MTFGDDEAERLAACDHPEIQTICNSSMAATEREKGWWHAIAIKKL